MKLPSDFDLWLDVKDYTQLVGLYERVCFEKATIERLCKTHNIPIPTERNETCGIM